MLAKPLALRGSTIALTRPTNALVKPLLFLLGVLLLSLPPRVSAQATGQVAGAVSDQTGSVISGAKVELISTATGQVRETSSGSDGAYTFPLVAPGNYQLRTGMNGFMTNLVKQMRVLVNGTTHLDMKMQVGS